MILICIKGFLFSLILAYGAYKDIRSREIPDIIPLLVLIAGLIQLSLFHSFAGFLLTGLPFLIAGLIDEGMGGGDIKLMAACGFLLGPRGGILQIIIGLSLALLYVLIQAWRGRKRTKRKDKIPLVPFLGAGGIISFLMVFMGGYF